MDRSNFCGCKGVRTCLLCEERFGIGTEYQRQIYSKIKSVESFVYCMFCDKVYPGWNENEYLKHPFHDTVGYNDKISGIFIELNFLSDDEENRLETDLDLLPWDTSQSGRRKQNFGPNCNFKKRKIKIGYFRGFPAKTKFVQEKFNSVPLLKDYQTIEQCSLEYDPLRGASIDPHIDDCWIWGERIVSVNLLSDCVLILTKYKGDKKRYNLDLVPETYREVEDIAIRIPMPRKSLLILYGDARYNWEHCILREDVKARRICLAYREFTKPYLPGGVQEDKGKAVIDVAQYFW